MAGSVKPLNVDILHAICAALGEDIIELDDRESWEDGIYGAVMEQKSRRALFSVALASRTFSQVAIGQLWRKLDNLGPLLNVLGYKCVRGSASQRDYLPDSPERWERFEWYAKRVKSLCFTAVDETLPQSILNHHPLVPNLRILYWKSKSLHLANSFFCTQLKHFQISSDDRETSDRVSTSLCSLAASKAGIQSLTFYEFNTMASAQLVNFPHLVRLTIPQSGMSADNVVHILSHPHLRQLELSLETTWDNMVIIASQPGLKSLRVKLFSRWSSMLEVLNVLPEQEVLAIDIAFHIVHQSLWHQYREVMTLIETRFFRSLRRFRFTFEFGDRNRIVASHFVEPLKAFSDLEHLRLSFSITMFEGPYLDYNDVAGLAYAMPNLRSFFLDLDGANKRITPRSLEILATSCPQLESIGINVLLEDTHTAALADVPITSSALKELDIRLTANPPLVGGTMIIANPPARHPLEDPFVHFLDRLFPNLEKVETNAGWDLWTPLSVRKAARRTEQERLKTS